MSLELFSLAGKTALITGSSRGLGRAFAEGLAAAGATVILNGTNSERLSQAQKDMSAKGMNVDTSLFDVTDEAAIKAAFDRLDAAGVQVDILINNAGIQFRKPMLELDTADWQRVIDTNLTSAFMIGSEAAKRMVKRGYGKIVNIGSLTSELARATVAPYTVAKGGHQNADQGDGGRMGRTGSSGECNWAWLHADRHERGAHFQPGIRRVGEGTHTGTSLGQTRRTDRNSNLSLLRCFQLCERPDHLCRWRHDFRSLR